MTSHASRSDPQWSTNPSHPTTRFQLVEIGLDFGRGEQPSHDGVGLNDLEELRSGSDDEQLLGIGEAGHHRPPGACWTTGRSGASAGLPERFAKA